MRKLVVLGLALAAIVPPMSARAECRIDDIVIYNCPPDPNELPPLPPPIPDPSPIPSPPAIPDPPSPPEIPPPPPAPPDFHVHLQGNTGWVCHTEESANPLHSGTLCVKAGDFHTGLVGPHSHEGFVWHNYPVADLDPGTKEATFIYEWRPYPNGSGYLREAIAPPPNTITDLYVPWPQAPCCQRISLSIERYGGDADASVGSWAFDSAHGPAMTTRPPDSSAPPPGAE